MLGPLCCSSAGSSNETCLHAYLVPSAGSAGILDARAEIDCTAGRYLYHPHYQLNFLSPAEATTCPDIQPASPARTRQPVSPGTTKV